MDTHIEHVNHTASARAIGRSALSYTSTNNRLFKPSIFLLLSLPFLYLVYTVFNNQLGGNPIEAITHFTGEWALRILLLSLAMTPLRMVLKKPWPIRLRRMVGLFAFFYVFLHLLTYTVLDQQFDVAAIVADIIDRPYITAGFVAFLVLVPLALTSTKSMMKKLGKRWQSLHKMVYIAAIASVVHYVWLTRGDQIEPIVYLAVLIGLLLFRVKKFFPRST